VFYGDLYHSSSCLCGTGGLLPAHHPKYKEKSGGEGNNSYKRLQESVVRLVKRFCRSLLLVALVSSLCAVSGLAAAVQVPNPSFEEALVDGVPPGWPSCFGNVSFGDPELQLSADRAKESIYSIRIEDRDREASYGLRSAQIPAEPGREYEATVQVFLEEGVAQLYLEFWNKSGERIQANIGSANTQGAWVPITIRQTAPEGTTSLTLLLYSHRTNTGVAFYDAVELREL
jgi:hypothetical protein